MNEHSGVPQFEAEFTGLGPVVDEAIGIAVAGRAGSQNLGCIVASGAAFVSGWAWSKVGDASSFVVRHGPSNFEAVVSGMKDDFDLLWDVDGWSERRDGPRIPFVSGSFTNLVARVGANSGEDGFKYDFGRVQSWSSGPIDQRLIQIELQPDWFVSSTGASPIIRANGWVDLPRSITDARSREVCDDVDDEGNPICHTEWETWDEILRKRVFPALDGALRIFHAGEFKMPGRAWENHV